jgi:hypothetical protein
MAYTTDFKDAARRHQQAASCLHDCEPHCRRRDVAGYLYGIAAECALKEIMRVSRWTEPDHLHFPDLKQRIRDGAQGRYASVLRKFADDDGFMNSWDIAMRYAPRRDIDDRLVVRWRNHAQEAIAAMEEC